MARGRACCVVCVRSASVTRRRAFPRGRLRLFASRVDGLVEDSTAVGKGGCDRQAGEEEQHQQPAPACEEEEERPGRHAQNDAGQSEVREFAPAAVADCAANDAGHERPGAGADDECDEEAEKAETAQQKADNWGDDKGKDKSHRQGDDVVPSQGIEVDVLLFPYTVCAAVADRCTHGAGETDGLAALVAAQERFPIRMVGTGQGFRLTVAPNLDRGGFAVINGAPGRVTEDLIGLLDGGQLLRCIGPVLGRFEHFRLVQNLQASELLRDLFLPGVFWQVQ